MIAAITGFAIDTLVWTGALIAAVMVLRRPVARLFGPGLAYALWLLPLARLALPPLPVAWLPKEFAPAAPQAVPAVAGADTVVTIETIPAEAHSALPWALLLTVAWFAGALLFLVVRWREYRAMRTRLLAEAREVDRRGGVRLVETPAVAAPVAFGLRDKVIALPPKFMITGTIAERALAIEHELAHHCGGDLLANWLAQPLLALHWFNPLAWTAWNAMRRDQEAACDARALAGSDAARRAAYARVIASFAAGDRLQTRTALAAPMACPVLGDKSIVHRLRSLTMTDISPRRRRAGRWALGFGAALALPLTATVVYAGEEAPPVPPTPAVPAAPAAADAPKVERRVIIETHHIDDSKAHGDHAERKMFESKIEKDGKTIIIRTDHPLDEAKMAEHLARIEAMTPEAPLPPATPGEPRRMRKIIMMDGEHVGHAPMAMAMADVMHRCPGDTTIADANAGTEVGDAKDKTVNRTRILLCAKPGEGKAQALASVRRARDKIAGSAQMSPEIRDDILRQLDSTIAKLEKDAG